MITLAVDCMGGDHGLPVTMPACMDFLAAHADGHLLLVGLPDAMAAYPSLLSHPRCRVVAASEVVAMDDPVEVALRRKK
ncbi:MAG: phosphate acyltransferase, partial [Burkholderiaceae bacterium]|nr:phosphate acyltransferase [Burkholderiaceae bacterium]